MPKLEYVVIQEMSFVDAWHGRASERENWSLHGLSYKRFIKCLVDTGDSPEHNGTTYKWIVGSVMIEQYSGSPLVGMDI